MNPRRPGDQRFGLFHSGVLIQWARGPEAALAGQRGEEGKLRRTMMIAQAARGPEKRGMIEHRPSPTGTGLYENACLVDVSPQGHVRHGPTAGRRVGQERCKGSSIGRRVALPIPSPSADYCGRTASEPAPGWNRLNVLAAIECSCSGRSVKVALPAPIRVAAPSSSSSHV
jgi:hypothetical protein